MLRSAVSLVVVIWALQVLAGEQIHGGGVPRVQRRPVFPCWFLVCGRPGAVGAEKKCANRGQTSGAGTPSAAFLCGNIRIVEADGPNQMEFR